MPHRSGAGLRPLVYPLWELGTCPEGELGCAGWRSANEMRQSTGSGCPVSGRRMTELRTLRLGELAARMS
jgi:hypothetical protein